MAFGGYRSRRTASRRPELSPALLLDLGGHSADNHPLLLSQRLAVQASYLGFDPTYAACCDWWIVIMLLCAGLTAPTRPEALAPARSQPLLSLSCMDCLTLRHLYIGNLRTLFMGVLTT